MAVDTRMRFETYVVGAANKMAVSAAHSITETPGLSYNPLVVSGGSGVGKTHLLQAIGNAIGERHPTLRVEYLTLDDFAGQLHDAVAAGETDKFKQTWGRVDVLLLDDIQFLTERRETQSELLRLLEALQGTGRQIVMTTDRPPAEIADVDRRLFTWLSGGLVVGIGAPDYETPVAATLDFQRFLSDIASAVTEHVEGWKSRVSEAVAGWAAAGYRTTALERLLEEAEAPEHFESVLRGFGAAVKKLKELEGEAVSADPALAGHAVFRDPERLRDAQAIVQRARSDAVKSPVPSVELSRAGFVVGTPNQLAVRADGDAHFLDDEKVVWEWSDVASRVLEEMR